MNNTELQRAIELALLNPSLLQKRLYNSLESILGGTVDVVNASNPFSYLLEVNTATAAAQAAHHQSLIQLMYPKHAISEETLFRFMSDKDYDGRFATPSRAPFKIFIHKDEILQRAVQVPGSSVRKVIIPRNTNLGVGGVNFGFQYPLEIRLMAHGGLQLVWDVEKVSPLETLTSNVVDWSTVQSVDGEFVVINFELQQFTLDHRTEVLNSSLGFVKTYALEDDFYYCRVYQSTDGTNWKEINTTHTDQTYDPTVPTACLKVSDGNLRVEVPQVYFSTGLMNGNLRVDIYTTKGALNMALDGLTANSFVMTWNDYDSDDSDVYSAPLALFTQWVCYSEGAATGGSAAIDFETQRARVLSNGLTTNTEVSPAQLEVSLQKLGYGVVKNVDQIGDLIFLATRALPNPEKNQIVSGANCSVETFAGKMSELVKSSTVVDNGARITLLPKTLYKYVDGKVEMCLDSEANELRTLAQTNPETLANLLNQAEYIYSPFHYVFDTTQRFFECRGYYLGTPGISERQFVSENETAEIEVATGSYSFERTEAGWNLYVKTRSGASYQELKDSEVFCQLGVLPVGESSYAYLNGELYGYEDKERVWLFKINTNFDFDYQHNLTLTNFRMFGNDPDKISLGLSTQFVVLHAVSTGYPATVKATSIDSFLGKALLPAGTYGVVQEYLTLKFGTPLNNLWSNARTVVTEEDYLRYTSDVVDTWTETEYERDPGTGAIKWRLSDDGTQLISTVVHEKGDIKYMADGVTPVLLHQVDEIKFDEFDQPIVISKRALERQVDLFFLEAAVLFATNSADVDYRESLADSLVLYLDRDIGSFSKKLLAPAELYFWPERTLGQTKAIIEDGKVSDIPSSLSFDVTVYLTALQYSNTALRESIAMTIKKVIANALKKDSFAISEVVETIRQSLGNDAVPIDIAGLGDRGDLTTFTLYDQSSRCGIRHKLVVDADETLRLEDDIAINWVRHRAS